MFRQISKEVRLERRIHLYEDTSIVTKELLSFKPDPVASVRQLLHVETESVYTRTTDHGYDLSEINHDQVVGSHAFCLRVDLPSCRLGTRTLVQALGALLGWSCLAFAGRPELRVEELHDAKDETVPPEFRRQIVGLARAG